MRHKTFSSVLFFAIALLLSSSSFAAGLPPREHAVVKLLIKQHFLLALSREGSGKLDVNSPYRLALYGAENADKLKAILADETRDEYVRLAAAEGLAYLGDNSGTRVLEKSLFGKFALTNSTHEKSEAALSLLFLGYTFPKTFLFSRLVNPLYPELDVLLE